MSLIAHWVEIHTFTERNGPELNETSSEEIPDGRYVPVGEVERVRQQLAGAVAENEKLRLQVAALENDGMELAARLGEAEEQIARLRHSSGAVDAR